MGEIHRAPFDATPKPKEDWLDDAHIEPLDDVPDVSEHLEPIVAGEITVGPARLKKAGAARRETQAQAKKPGEWSLPADFDVQAPATKEQVAQIKHTEKRAVHEKVLADLRAAQTKMAIDSRRAKAMEMVKERRALREKIEAKATEILKENAKAKAEAALTQEKQRFENEQLRTEKKRFLADTYREQAVREAIEKNVRAQDVDVTMAPMERVVKTEEKSGFWSRIKESFFGKKMDIHAKYREQQKAINRSIERATQKQPSFFSKIFEGRTKINYAAQKAPEGFEQLRTKVKNLELQMRWTAGQKRRNLEAQKNAIVNQMIRSVGKDRTIKEIHLSEKDIKEALETNVSDLGKKAS